ncbi:thiamine pyrophosphate-binding protein [Variovorax sp. RT4R15]|uniref:thiamine pyrophosphate-binding protein n=1 Tax=Variovorax sp. RT4R15 TaxID=3443737 RepID=UPI003F47AD43
MTTLYITVAEVIARACVRHGVKNAFGVPGGGSSLDLIEALAREGIAFRLCRTETAAVLMAAADAEIRNGFGVAITTQGPGTASGMNGVAHASLDRAPVLFISDGWTTRQRAFDTHQVFDQRAMSAPVVKASSGLESDDPATELEALVTAMLSAPWGPVHIELTGENARRQVAATEVRNRFTDEAASRALTTTVVGDAPALLRTAKRPVLLVGLEARDEGAPAQVLALAQRLRCPVLTTYKAKGIVSDEVEWVVGHFTGGAAEGECIAAADLIVLCGLDPVELIGRPWPYTAPVIDIALVRHPVHYVEAAAGRYGPLASGIESLLPICGASDWPDEEIASFKHDMSARLDYPGGGPGLTSTQVVEIALAAAGPTGACITVDAGAHMFSAMAFWRARSPGSALISNGLATMAFALPAGIARALNTPDVPTIAFTGDGGLMMCAGELATAAQYGARLCVIVFNDSALSLIALKQRNRNMAEAGVAWPSADFASVARGFGMTAFTARTAEAYEQALASALQTDGPCLIDVQVDPSGYRAQAKALRG